MTPAQHFDGWSVCIDYVKNLLFSLHKIYKHLFCLDKTTTTTKKDRRKFYMKKVHAESLHMINITDEASG